MNRAFFAGILGADADAATGCRLWKGPLSSDGYPVFYEDGEQHLVIRVRFALYVGQALSELRLRRVCPSPTCITPSHHVVQAPQRVAERLGYGLDDLRGIAALIRARRQREPDDATTCWDAARLAQLRFEGDRVKEWATRLDVPPLLVLAAYATLVRASERARDRGRSMARQ